MTTTTPALREYAINVTISGVAVVRAATEDEVRALATQVRVTDLDYAQGPVTIREITVISAEDIENEDTETDRAECEYVCASVTDTTHRYCPRCEWAVNACDRCNTCRQCGHLTDALLADDAEDLEYCATCRADTVHTEQDCACGTVTACANCNTCPKCRELTSDPAEVWEPDIDTHLDL